MAWHSSNTAVKSPQSSLAFPPPESAWLLSPYMLPALLLSIKPFFSLPQQICSQLRRYTDPPAESIQSAARLLPHIPAAS